MARRRASPQGGAGILASGELESADMSAITEVVKTDRVLEADQENDKLATEIAKT